MNESRAQELARQATGQDVVGLETLTGGQSSVVHGVVLANGQEVIVRQHADPGVYAATSRNLKILAGLGLPVPRVLGEVEGGIVLERLPGRDLRFVLPTLSLAQMTRIAQQVVGYQRIVIQSLPPGDGFGWVGIGDPGTHRSWPEALGFNDLPDDFAHYLSAVPPTCHLDDITGKNVLIAKGELSGLVDFDVVCYGDPVFWLALTATGIASDCTERELFYANELRRLWGLTPTGERAFAFYAARLIREFVARFAERETPLWRLRMETFLAQCTDRFSAP